MAKQHDNPFQVGQVIENHPFKFGDGAMLELFRHDLPNTVFVGLGNITADEQAMLEQVGAELGVMQTDNGGCLVVLKLGELAFDIQFNALAIPDDFFDDHELMHDTLSFSMLVIDTANSQLKVIRDFSVNTAITAQIVAAVKAQRTMTDVNAVNAENVHLLNTLTTEDLMTQVNLQAIQSVVAAPSCGCGSHHHHHHD
ncbi:hypothetical protein [Shewanella marina]|uniref:hypothetical protein n=1 Tax=Shewanella marina TaxID=487319 RepID=UPI000471C825|nr:hypothetical protein [Shewanella marina]